MVADIGYGGIIEFRRELAERGLSYVVALKASTSVQPSDAEITTPPWSGTDRRPKPGYSHQPTDLRALALSAGRTALRQVVWRHGTKKTPGNRTGAMRLRFITLRGRPANRNNARGTSGNLPACWMIAEWPPHELEPTDYGLSNLSTDTPIGELVQLAKMRWRIERDYRELTTGIGLDHFEGRSLPGWHRHVAQAICTHLRYDPQAPAPV